MAASTEPDVKQESMMLERQNKAFLKFAETGTGMPAYKWLDGVLNVPSKPPTPEQMHMAEIAKQIYDVETTLRGIKEQNFDILQAKYSLACEAVSAAVRYRQGVTRIPAFYEMCAFNNLIRDGLNLNPKPKEEGDIQWQSI